MGHGGARQGAGRKKKVDEEKVVKLSENAIKKEYGSLEEFFLHIAKESKNSLPHIKLLMEYAFGKPKERKEIEHSGELELPHDKLKWADE